MSPLSHEDDAARAVLAAFNIKRAINDYTKSFINEDFEPPIHIGICTGNAY